QALPVQAGEVTIDFILDERASELYAEEPRHSELVRVSYILAALNRNGYSLNNFSEKNYFYDRLMRVNILYEQKVFSNSGGTAAIAPLHVLWPVPARVITANTMGVINQNKGYDGDHPHVPPLETIEEQSTGKCSILQRSFVCCLWSCIRRARRRFLEMAGGKRE